MGLFRSRSKSEAKEPAPISAEQPVIKDFPSIRIHDDLVDLIWIADGPYRNYSGNEQTSHRFEAGGFRFEFVTSHQDEPSLIYTNQKVARPPNPAAVERPSYFPTYSGLSPQQKWMYLEFLSNPYRQVSDIGYVFVLYYGLERHLLSGDFDKAFDVVLKLRDVHPNKSFQAYSAQALILTCMLHNKGEYIVRFIQSLDKDYEFNFSDNLFLICFFSFGIPVKASDFMRMAKTFGFTNTNYIRKYPDLFKANLEASTQQRYGQQSLILDRILAPSDLRTVKFEQIGIFANVSIIDESVPVPMLAEVPSLKNRVYELLQEAHDSTKRRLAESRKSGVAVAKPKPPQKEKELPIFDKSEEQRLLREMNQAKNAVNLHFSYLQLHEFYYKYRDLDPKYLRLCEDYCLRDIEILPRLHKDYIEQESERLNQWGAFGYGPGASEELQQIRKTGFQGRIVAFKRLSIVYEKTERYKEAIDVCLKAVEYGQEVDKFKKKIMLLTQKL